MKRPGWWGVGLTTLLEPPPGSASALSPAAVLPRRVQNPKSKIQNALVAALLLVLAFAFMTPGLPPDRVAAPLDQLLLYLPWHTSYPDADAVFRGSDLLFQQLPWRHWVQQEFAAGRFPLWASAPAGGMSLFASFQPGVLYPLHLLWILLPIGAGLGIIMALKLWLAGLGMWGFLRALKLHPTAALLAALGFMFSEWMISLLTWQLTSVYLLLPWMTWAAYAWCRERSRWSLVGLALLIMCAVFGGHPEPLSLLGVTMALWSLGLLLTSPRRDWLVQGLGLGGAVLIGFALSAIQLFPFLEVLAASHLAIIRVNPLVPQQHLEAGVLISWLLPHYWGYTPEGIMNSRYLSYNDGYVGLVAPVGLILLGVGAFRRRIAWRLAGPWIAIGVFAWIVTYDDAFGTVIRSLPGFNQSVNARWGSIVAFAGLVVSAFGWDWFARWCATATRRIRWRGWVGGVGLVLAVEGLIGLLIHLAGVFPEPLQREKLSVWVSVTDDYRWYWTVWAGGVLVVLCGALALWASGGRAARIAPLIIGLVLVADLWRMMVPYNPTAPAAKYYPPTSFLQQLQRVVPATERLLVEGEVLPANTGYVYGFRDWRVQDSMLSERAYQAAVMLSPDMPKSVQTDYNMFLNNVRKPVAPLLGMRYFIFKSDVDPNHPEPAEPQHPDYTRLAYKDGLGLWAAEGVPGFAYLSDNLHVVETAAAAATWLRAVQWSDVRAYAALVEAPAAAVAAIQHDPAGTSPGNVTVQTYAPGSIRLQTNALRPALLVVAESWTADWQATLDGQPVNILRANYLSQGLVVPPGLHSVEFHYVPRMVLLGGAVSSGGLVLLLGLAIWSRRAGRVRSRMGTEELQR